MFVDFSRHPVIFHSLIHFVWLSCFSSNLIPHFFKKKLIFGITSKFFKNFIDLLFILAELFLAALGLRCCMLAFSLKPHLALIAAGEGCSLVAAHGLPLRWFVQL